MTIERIVESIFEYPDIQDLGIKGSHGKVWVPRDYVVAKPFQIAEAVLEAGQVVVNKVKERLSGTIAIRGTRGRIYSNTAPGD